jgi:ADP-ribose pyrophosphatase
MFKLKLINKKGKPKDYYLASRRKREELSCSTKNHDICDGVMIIPVTENDEIVMLKQYRPIISDYLYELPAGIVDKGETIEQAARRELYEETGLIGKSYEVILKPSYSSVGLTDETTAIVKMVVAGEMTNFNTEEDEEIEVFKIKKSDAKEFVKNHNVSIKGALVLLSL